MWHFIIAWLADLNDAEWYCLIVLYVDLSWLVITWGLSKLERKHDAYRAAARQPKNTMARVARLEDRRPLHERIKSDVGERSNQACWPNERPERYWPNPADRDQPKGAA